MMGVPLEDPAFVKGDNLSVIKNSSIPESVLKKKSNSVAYHYVRERVAMGIIEVRIYEDEFGRYLDEDPSRQCTRPISEEDPTPMSQAIGSSTGQVIDGMSLLVNS